MPIAIVGMACRFPGSDNPDTFFDSLVQKKARCSRVPPDRFNVDAFHHPDRRHAGTINHLGGYFLNDITSFDPEFFNMSTAEASATDPQQRLLLEVVYEALESAGITMNDIDGSDASCFVSSFLQDFKGIQNADPEAGIKHIVTGTGNTFLSARISHFFNLKGQSATIDTACSGSLVALHHACQSLRLEESSLAFVGGSNVILDPSLDISMSRMGFFSPDSKCFSFDDRANGYARGEGVAVVILKRLDEALRNNDPIRAIIRGTGANQDGRTPTITQPSRASQSELIRSVLRISDTAPSTIGFFEAHGTGTMVGDITEAAAIADTISSVRSIDDPLLVGSVKTNIGHTEATSGLAGLIKTAKALEEAVIPANLNFEVPNRNIDFEKSKIKVPTETIPWPTKHGVQRTACINSFGYGGTNAHAILEAACHSPETADLDPLANNTNHGKELPSTIYSRPEDVGSYQLFAISANDEGSLNGCSARLADHLAEHPDISLIDLAYTLGERRTMHQFRRCIVASERSVLMSELTATASAVHVALPEPPAITFVFSGQGHQWACMGRELIHRFELFRRYILQAESVIQRLGANWSLMNELLKDEQCSNLNEPHICQPASVALQIALFELLSHSGLNPRTVIGYSSGEIVAAYAAGFMPLESAMQVAYFRGLYSSVLSRDSSQRFGMAAIGLGDEAVRHEINKYTQSSGREQSIFIAGINSPDSTTISGDEDAINELLDNLQTRNVLAKKLSIHCPYHSPYMCKVAEGFRDSLHNLQYNPDSPLSAVRIVSTVSGRCVTWDGLGSAHWVMSLVTPVRLFESVTEACKQAGGASTQFWLEVGPHSQLRTPIRQIEAHLNSRFNYHSTLTRGYDSCQTFLHAVGGVFSMGYPIRFDHINRPCGAPRPKVLTNLPTYSWNHSKQYWVEPRMSSSFRHRRHRRHELLGAPVRDWSSLEPRWKHYIRISEVPWLAEHQVHDNIVFPAAGFLVMALEAAQQLVTNQTSDYVQNGWAALEIREAVIQRLLKLPKEDDGVEISLSLLPESMRQSSKSSRAWWKFKIFSFQNDECIEHCVGRISQLPHSAADGCERPMAEADSHEGLLPFPSRTFYRNMKSIGLNYGSQFQNIRNIRQNQAAGRSAGSIDISRAQSDIAERFAPQYLIHPVILDSLLQTPFAGGKIKQIYLPTYLERLTVLQGFSATSSNQLSFYTHSKLRGFETELHADVTAKIACHNDADKTVVQICNATYTAVEQKPQNALRSVKKHCFRPVWIPDLDYLQPSAANTMFTSNYVHENAESHELLAYYFMRSALQVAETSNGASLPTHLRRLVQWIAKEVKAISGLEFPVLETRARAEIRDMPPDDVAGRLLIRLGEKLGAIIRLEEDALTVLKGQDSLFEDVYESAAWLGAANQQISSYLAILSHKYPALHILEIGGGTGGTTKYILRILRAAFASYTFTDISSSFFERAQHNFAKFNDRMQYRKLNIEKDVASQGFDAQYDVVIAANVVHATRDIEDALSNIHQLLKPGGLLILLEITNPTYALSLVYGTLPGWWLFDDGIRVSGPTLPEQIWHDSLRRVGFSDFMLNVGSHDKLEDSVCRVMVVKRLHCVDDTPRRVFGQPLSQPRRPFKLMAVHANEDLQAVHDLNIALQDMSCDLVVHRVATMLESDIIDHDRVLVFIANGPGDRANNVFTSLNFEKFRKLVLHAKCGIFITRNDPTGHMLSGFLRTARSEMDRPFIHLISNEFNQTVAQQLVQIIRASFMDSENRQMEYEYRISAGTLQIPRYLVDGDKNEQLAAIAWNRSTKGIQPFYQPGRSLKLSIDSPGLLDTLIFKVDDTALDPLTDGQVEIQVRAVGMNFQDVVTAMGQLPNDFLGLDCAGIVTQSHSPQFKPGDQVFTWALGAYQTSVRCNQDMVAPVPAGVSLAEAASIPVVFSTALYILKHVVQLQIGDTVLIHSAAGGLGQAAIQLCQILGARVYATVGSDDKMQLLTSVYGIPVERIFYSRDESFVQGILDATSGKGVDVIINSLSGELLHASWEQCLAEFGHFVEVGKRDVTNHARLNMATFSKNTSFTSVDLTELLRKKTDVAARLHQQVAQLLLERTIKPVTPINTFSFSNIEIAFRSMQTGTSMGKIVLEPQQNDVVPVRQIAAGAKLELRSDACYVIAGGFGGIGSLIARWLASKGARMLLLLSRFGPTKPENSELLAALRSAGITVEAPICDIANVNAVNSCLSRVREQFPIKGVIQAAMVLDDRILETTTWETFDRVTRPKVQGTINLHLGTRPDKLDFFIMLSSFSGIAGTPSQAGYAAGNTLQDYLAQQRAGQGFPGTSINMAVIKDVGWVEERTTTEDRYHVGEVGAFPLEEEELLAIIEIAIKSGGLTAPQIVTGCGTVGTASELGIPEPWWFKDPRFSHLKTARYRHRKATSQTDKRTEATPHIERELERCKSFEEASAVILLALRNKLSHQMQLPLEKLDPARSTTAYGVDSLISLELRSWVHRELKADIAVTKILGETSLKALADEIARASELLRADQKD